MTGSAQPSPVPAAPRWSPTRIARTIMALATGALVVVYVVLLAAADLDATSDWSRIIFISIVVFISITVALDRRANTHQIKEHIDLRAAEASTHIDRVVEESRVRARHRLDAIADALARQGLVLEEITGDIPRIMTAATTHSHGERIGSYEAGYADGLAARPMSGKVMRIHGRPE